MKKILIFIVVLTATSLISSVAYSQAKGTISGRVTDPSANGIPNVAVSAYDVNSGNWTNGSQTDSNGNYRLNVPAGTYNIQFLPYPSSGYYAPGWYNNKSNSVVADLVTVRAFRTTSNINAQLEFGGAISGRVTDPSGNGIANVRVDAFDLYGHWMPGSSTDNNGKYSFNMPAGTYKLHFNPLPSSGYYAPEWYEKKSNSTVANQVTVSASQTTGNINAQLEIGGTISGRVTGLLGNGIANTYVYAVDSDWFWINGLQTDSNGNYIFNLPAGTYKIRFISPSSGYYAPEWYDNKDYFQVADLVDVASQTTSNISARLGIGGMITGRVTGPSGSAIADVYVQAYDPDDSSIIFNGSTTNGNGSFTIPLAAGNYKIGFSPGPDAGNFAPEWYKDRSDFESAEVIPVRKGINSRINVQMNPDEP